MNLLQTGYLGTVGPVFLGEIVGSSKRVIVQGSFENSKLVLRTKRIEYASNLPGFVQSNLTLSPYADNQILTEAAPSYYAPPGGVNSIGSYQSVGEDWVLIPGAESTPTTTTGTTPTPTTGTTPTPTNGGNNPASGNGYPVNNQPNVVYVDRPVYQASTPTLNPAIIIGGIALVFLILRAQSSR